MATRRHLGSAWISAMLFLSLCFAEGLPAETSTPEGLSVSLTGLFIKTAEGMARVVRVRLTGPIAGQGGRLKITATGKTIEKDVPSVASGDREFDAHLPSQDGCFAARFELVSPNGTIRKDVQILPARRWTLYVAPTVHTDIGYTHHQSEIPAIHNTNTDRAIELCREFPDYRFRLECSWAARVYQKQRPPEQFSQLIDLARQRRIGVEANYVNMLTGLCTAEELARLLYPSAELARRFGVPFETATQNDTPTYVWSFPSILRQAGIRYLTVGVNNNGTRGPVLRGGLDRKSPFWWEGPDGSKVLTWYAGGYVDTHRTGLNESVSAVEKKLPAWLQRWEQRDDYPYDAVLIHGAYGDNQAIDRTLPKTIAAWNAKYAYPRIVMTACDEFFRHIGEKFQDRIPTVRGCGGGWWEDGAGSSARETAINRDSHHRIVAAETLWSAAHLVSPAITYPRARIDQAWDNILMYDEHTWGARRWTLPPEHRNVVTQWATKARFATDAERDSVALLAEGVAALARTVGGKARGLLVFNPLSWNRDDVVCFALATDEKVVDPDGTDLPIQTLSDEGSNRKVCMLARNVPATGYRRYAITRSSNMQAASGPATSDPTQLENRFYRVTLDARSGGIASIVDKELGAELVDVDSPYRLGEVLYASGGKGTQAVDWVLREPARFTYHRPAGATWRITSQGQVLTSAQSETHLTMFPKVGLAVTLYHGIKRLDLAVHLEKTLTYELEGVYVAFPFFAKPPEFRIEVGGGWVRPDRDMLPGACLDWFCAQGSVIVSSERLGVSWSPRDTPLFSLGDIHTGQWLERLELNRGSIFAYVMNNYWPTNYKPGQDGKHVFHYSLLSDRHLTTTAATRHGREVSTPLVAFMAEAPSGATLPESGSFWRISAPNVILTAFKRAEDDDGYVLRFMEVAGQPTSFEVATQVLPTPQSARRCDLVERDLSPLPIPEGKVGVSIKAYGTETLRLKW